MTSSAILAPENCCWASDQLSAADLEPVEAAAVDVVGAAFLGGVLDVPGHHLLPNPRVRELFLDAGGHWKRQS
jgi:hypothetical protein